MAFTSEEKLELATIIADVMDKERDRRRLKYQEEQKSAVPPEHETKIYLVTSAPYNRIAFPDEKGRAILHDTFYARVVRRKGAMPHSGFTMYDVEEVTAVAFSDGKLLDKPFRVILNSTPFMVEIEEGFLETI